MDIVQEVSYNVNETPGHVEEPGGRDGQPPAGPAPLTWAEWDQRGENTAG